MTQQIPESNTAFEGIPIEMRVIILRHLKEKNPGLTGPELWKECREEVAYINEIFQVFFGNIIPNRN